MSAPASCLDLDSEDALGDLDFPPLPLPPPAAFLYPHLALANPLGASLASSCPSPAEPPATHCRPSESEEEEDPWGR